MPPIRNLSNDQLAAEIRRASRQERTRTYKRLVECFGEVGRAPERRAPLAGEVARVITRMVSPTGVTRFLLEDKPVAPSDVAEAGIDALAALGEHRAPQLGTPAVLDGLRRAFDARSITSDTKSRLLELLGQGGMTATESIVSTHVLPALERPLTADDPDPDVASTALSVVGELLTSDAVPVEALCTLLEAGFDHRPDIAAAAVTQTGRAIANVHENGDRMRLDGHAESLSQLLGTVQFDPADRVKLVDLLSRQDRAAAFGGVPSGVAPGE